MKNTKIHLTTCHRMPERSFFWKGKQFPICARCTGIHLGYFSFPLFAFGVIFLNVWLSLLFIIPTYLDGTIQAFFNKESNNTRRFITGLFAGIGTMSIISKIGIYLGLQILKYF